MDLVAEGFDLAIRGGILPENGYVARLLLPVTPLVCASPAYFAARGQDAGYLGTVVINVGLREGEGHYHVPLLCTPWSYSTYRGT